MKGINFGYEYSLNLGKINARDNMDPAAIERVMNDGEGVAQALYGRSIAQAGASGPTTVRKQRTSSSGALTKKNYSSESVAQLISSSPTGV
jgi:hypothetical protein